ncbi:MAG TPA: hypothetical protein VFG14_05550 [Chthoniobacteraceae bacterium]|nr:hypothetical protein [Chthoniobacteraceae bacterium]
MNERKPSDSTRLTNKGTSSLLLLAGLLVLCIIGWYGFKKPTSGTPKPPTVEGEWQLTGLGHTRGIGGLSLFRFDDAKTTYLAVFDSKRAGEPRIAFIDLEEGKHPLTRDLKWPDNDLPVDLEALTRMPGDDTLFFAATSGGQLWRLRAQTDSLTLLGFANLPHADAPELEGFDLQRLEGKIVAVWAGRGDGDRSAALCVGLYDESTGKPTLTHRVEFRAPWPAEPTVRHISDLRVDPLGVIYVTSSMDPGNDGPFNSALYIAGTVTFSNDTPHLRVNESPIRLRTDPGRKVEALEFVPGKISGLVLGCDDENFGGAILETWKGEPPSS